MSSPTGTAPRAGRNVKAGGVPTKTLRPPAFTSKPPTEYPATAMRKERGEGDVLTAPSLLDAFQVDPQPRLLPESRVDSLGKGESLGRFTGDRTSLGRARQLGVFGVSIVGCFGLSQAGPGFRRRAPVPVFLGVGSSSRTVEVQRRKNSLGEAFLVAVPFVAATQVEGSARGTRGASARLEVAWL